MKRVLLLLAVLPLLLGLFAGCASYDADRNHGQSLAGVRHFFVLSNASDNHALDRHIASALRARGFTAETGPLTMMPDETQAIVTYQDQWSWDFGDHLVHLQISVRNRKAGEPFANLRFNTRLPTRASTAGIVSGLVDKLFAGGKH